MHPIQDLFLESFSYVLQFDMHFYMHSYLDNFFYSCKKWVLHLDSPMYGKVTLRLPTISRIKLSLHHVVERRLEDIPDDLPRISRIKASFRTCFPMIC
jgi:hypothetical protein